MRIFSSHRSVGPSDRPPSSARLVLLVLAVAGFLLVPASHAAAVDFPLVITTDGSGEGTVECNVEGGGAEPCDAEYEEGTKLSLVAEPDPGSEFVEFYGDCGPLECELTMDEAHSVTVTFEAEEEFFPLAIETAGSGSGTVECEVEAGPEPCEEEYPAGTELSLVAEADPGSEFVEWIGDCGPETCELTMDAEHEAIALFELEPEEFALEIDFDGTGTGDVECELQEGPEECQETYIEGTELVLIPNPDPENEFVEFSGDCSLDECELVMNQDHEVTATFDEVVVPRTLGINVVGEGEVECELEAGPEPCDPEYESGTELTLVAVPDSGFEFDGFSSGTGSATGCTASPCTFTITANSSVTATFSPETIKSTLTITKVGTGTGTVKCEINAGPEEACAASYPNGTSIKLKATADSGSEFAGFSEGTGSASSCSTSPCTFTIEANSTVKATFNLIPRTLSVTTAGTGSGEVKCKFNGGSAGACTSPQPNGTTVEIIATANSGSEFAGFSSGTGSASSCSTSPCSFTITANSAVTATFNPISATEEFALTVNKAGTGSGSVTCDGGACAAKYAKGTKVALAASAASGSTFSGWSGGGCSGTGGCTVTIEADTTVTATFTADSTPPPPAEGKVKVAGSAAVKSGKAQLKLTCTGGPCKGSLKLKAKVKQGTKTKNLVIGKGSFSLAEGATTTLKVKLSGPAKQELAKGKTLKASVSGTGVTSSKVKLKPPKK